MFNFLVAHAASLFSVPVNTYDASGTLQSAGLVTSLTSNVTDTIGDTGMLALIVAAIAIPLVFYVATRLIKLMRLESAKDKALNERADKAMRESRRLTRNLRH